MAYLILSIFPLKKAAKQRRRLPISTVVSVSSGGALVASAMVALATLAGCDRGSVSAGGPDNPAEKGQRLYAQACTTCHGFTGQGMPHQGAALRTSPFVAGQTDAALVEFVKAGRMPEDPKSTMKLLMPPKGGVPGLTDDQLRQIVAYLRALQKDAGVTPTAAATSK